MNHYEAFALNELKQWRYKVIKNPNLIDKITKRVQNKMSSIIPEKAHDIITSAIKNMVKAVLTGSEYTTSIPIKGISLYEREEMVRGKLKFYKKAAVITGVGTGGAGMLISLADFPILLSIKMKFLFDTASIYGFNVKNFNERLYILYIFQLAFSSKEKTKESYYNILNFERNIKMQPQNINEFDWKTFQQEYRDYIDIAKLLQFIPGIGAVVGAVANYNLLDKLGETAVNAYRLRVFKEQ
ncbi:MAG: EcsC family protein [Clostridiaceae bacterium]